MSFWVSVELHCGDTDERHPQPRPTDIPFSEALRTKRSVILTCHLWASLGIPLVYDLIHIHDDRFKSQPLSDVLSSPIPSFTTPADLPTKTRWYGHLVKGIVANEIAASDLLRIIPSCPNIRWISVAVLDVQSQSEWISLESALSSLPWLEACEIHLHPRDQTTRSGDTPLRFASLKFLESTHGTEMQNWECPSLRRLSLCLASPRNSLVADSLPVLERHGPHLEILYIAGFLTILGVDIPTLCPLLTQLIASSPRVLSSSWSGFLYLPGHPNLVDIKFTNLDPVDLKESHREFPEQNPLQCIRRQNFPMLRKVYCLTFSPSRRLYYWGSKACLPLWWKTLMEAWKDEDIKLCLLSDGSEVTLDMVCRDL